MTAPDAGSRARHPSLTPLNPGSPSDPRPGVAGPAVPVLLPRGAGAATFRRQQRHLFYSASIVTLLLVMLADFAPVLAGWLAGWIVLSLAIAVVYVAAHEIGHWWARRRWRRFLTHTEQALRVVS